jgi:hypothetical protein
MFPPIKGGGGRGNVGFIIPTYGLHGILLEIWLGHSMSHPGFGAPRPGREHNHQVCWDQVSHI